ncbi:acyltransferase, partial [uncultured Megamonas sp.]|uniref:acyltransferase n=1 Tax=uncultured Megamonas sp. TaxID=286140 RepID=UPI0025F7430B
MSMKKERVPAIEYMRGISMLGVVGIHVGSQYLMNNPTPNLQLLALYEIVTRFSVPIFFFISAFGLFYNLDLDDKFNYKNFMKRRFKTVLIPYLVWSVFYILHYTVTNQTLYLLHPLNLIGILFFGLACYQLYFMILLVWFYALMPLWIFIVKRLNLVLLAVLFVFQMAVDYYSSFLLNPYGMQNEIVKAIFMYRLNYWVIHYVFIFLLGGYVSVHYD